MTENELIKYYKRAMEIHNEEFGENPKATELYKTTIGLIEEIQQYRAIGTVEEIETLNFSSNQLRLVNLVEKYKEKLKEYEEIGTVEEIKHYVRLAGNMEQSDRHYDSGWIACEDRLPEQPRENPVFDGKPLELHLVSVKGADDVFRAFWNGKFFTDGWNKVDVVAWMPLPEPYRP